MSINPYRTDAEAPVSLAALARPSEPDAEPPAQDPPADTAPPEPPVSVAAAGEPGRIEAPQVVHEPRRMPVACPVGW